MLNLQIQLFALERLPSSPILAHLQMALRLGLLEMAIQVQHIPQMSPTPLTETTKRN